MTRYVTIDEVRAVSGISSELISDASYEQIITDAEYDMERRLNTSFAPITIVEYYNGDGTERLKLRQNPVVKVRALTIDETDVTPKFIRVRKESGVIWLTTSAEISYFKSKTSERDLVRIRYDKAQLYATTTQTDTADDVVAGSTVSIEVTSSTNFLVNDYVEIEGFDSLREVARITAVADSTHITVDTLSLPHESGSLVSKQIVPPTAKKLMQIAASISGVARVVGSSFDELTSYSVSDIATVTKGEPYTQWRETAIQLRKEYDTMIKSFRNRPAIG